MQNIMNDTVANIWAEMSEEERQDKILSVMNNVDAAIKFAAYDWNELPDGITNLIDSNSPLNELSPETKMSAFKKAATYTRKPGEITNKVLHNKRMSQAYTFEKHVSPQLQAQANTIAKLIGPEFIASIDKGMYGTEEMPEISIKFFEPTNKQNNATLHVYSGSGYNAGDISTDLKLNNIELSEPIQRKLVRFADAVYKSEISSNLKENHNIKNTMNKSLLKSLIKECYKEVLAENEEMDISDITPRIYKNKGYGNTVAPMLQKLKSKLSPAGWQIITKFTQGHKEGGFNRPAILDRLAKADVTPISKGDIISYNNKILYGLIDTGDLIQDPVTKKYTLNTTLAENEEMDLPSDTGKNINMGFDNNIGLDVDKRMSGNMNKVMSQIEMLKNKLAPFIADFKSKKLSKEEYMAATKGLVADLKKAQMALELMMAKL